MKLRARRPSAATVIACIALVVALSSSAWAAGIRIPNGSIRSKHIKNRDVRAADLAANSVNAAKMVNGAADAEIGLTRFNQAMAASDQTAAASEDAARIAAPTQALGTWGALTIYAKCFRRNNTVYAEAFISTSLDGAVFDADTDELQGDAAANQYLNIATAETSREIDVTQAGLNDTSFQGEGDTEFAAAAPDGTRIYGVLNSWAKNGTPNGGDGPYGTGHTCGFFGHAFKA